MRSLLPLTLLLALTGCGLWEPELLHDRFLFDIGTVQIHADDTLLVAVVTDSAINWGATVLLPAGASRVCIHTFPVDNTKSVTALVWTSGDDEVEPRSFVLRRFMAGVEVRIPADWSATIIDSAVTRIDMARWGAGWWERSGGKHLQWCER